MLDHLTTDEIENLLDSARRELTEHEAAVSRLTALVQTARAELEARHAQEHRIAAEAVAPMFNVGDRVKTHNGFTAVVTEVDPDREDGASVSLKVASGDSRNDVSLGWWYRHQLTKIAEEG